MIGTLIGLINMLADIDDAEKIAPGMALALITTLYGSVLANLIFLPIAGKLRTRSDEEVLYRQIIWRVSYRFRPVKPTSSGRKRLRSCHLDARTGRGQEN